MIHKHMQRFRDVLGTKQKQPAPAPPHPFYLQSTDSCALEAQVCFEVLSNFPHQTLEGKFADQKFSGLLITSKFTECHSTGPLKQNIKEMVTKYIRELKTGVFSFKEMQSLFKK